jgi:2-isopropylmalate synthase
VPTATVRIAAGAERFEEAATGDGPVDAIFNAIDRALGISTKLLEYVVQAVTPGRQAIGGVTVSLEIDGRAFVGRGASTDILEASAKAYVNALNRWKAYLAARKGGWNGDDAH